MGRPPQENPGILVALKLRKATAPELVSRAKFIVQQMTGNASFPSPDPPLVEVSAAIDALEGAQALALMRTKGSVEARDEKRATLELRLEYLKGYVGRIANADRPNATSIVESSGMYVKPRKGPAGHVFTANGGRVSGEVDLVAPSAGDRAAYEFQYSLDGGKTWRALPEPFTTKAKVTVTGLSPGSTAHFRYRTAVKGVTGDWSNVVATIVV